MRQIVDVVRERVSLEQARVRVHLEWQTRALCSFLAQTVDSPKAAKKLLEVAGQLSLIPQPATQQSARPVAPAGEVDVVRAGQPPDPGVEIPATARPGSFERLAAGLGRTR